MSILTELSPDQEAAVAYINRLTELDHDPMSTEFSMAVVSMTSVIAVSAGLYENIQESGILYDQEFIDHISRYPHGLLSTLRSTMKVMFQDDLTTNSERKYDGS